MKGKTRAARLFREMAAAFSAILLCSCGSVKEATSSPAATASEARIFGLRTIDEKHSTVDRHDYHATLRGQGASLSIGLPLAADAAPAPLIEECLFSVCEADGTRLLDEAELSSLTTSLVERPDGLVISTTKGRSTCFAFESTRAFRGDAILFEYRLTARTDITGCRRASLELTPAWNATVGAQLDLLMADGSRKTLELPTSPPTDGMRTTLFAGDITSLKMTGAYDMKGAGFEVTGNLAAFLEHTGSRFRWHLGVRDLPTALKPGDSLAFSLTLRPTPPAMKSHCLGF